MKKGDAKMGEYDKLERFIKLFLAASPETQEAIIALMKSILDTMPEHSDT